ncbi:restriction endonuclease subunit S [Bifidobacterium bifidum]|uniref:restriction endonuclease subunit S n=1 Tax=Bifidobacterium bifidum TaxID=1681 RepID=UPI003CFCAFB7
MAEQAKVPAIRFAGFTDPWEQRKLGDVASSFDYGLNAAATEYDGQNKYLRITDIDDETHEFSKSGLTTPLADLAMSADYLLKEGDLLFARTGASVGKTYLYRQFDGMVYFAGFLIRARIGEGADPEFAYQATLTDAYKKYVAITSQRSGQPGVNAQEYADYQLMLPSKTEQQQIGMTLRSLDSLITLHQRKYDKLVVFKKSMLEKMFPKDGESVPAIRFAGFTDPWEQRKLGNCGTTYSGLSGKTKEDFGHGNARFVPYTNVFDNPLADTERLEAVEIDSSQNKVAYGDVFFTVSSETPNEVGMSSVWLSDQDDVYLNSFCFGYRQDSTFDPHYLAYMLRSSSIRSDLTLLAQGISRFNISKNKVMELSVAVPSAAEQKQIGQYFARLDDLITLHQRKLELLQNIKKSLLDKMFV